MIKEAYVSFEIAKLLKEKGFNERSAASYDSKGQLQEGYAYWNKTPIWHAAPTHQMTMAWLREHGLYINVVISYDYSVDANGNEVDRWTFWLFEIFSSFSGNLIYTEEVNQYDSYEETVEAALKYCLENLI